VTGDLCANPTCGDLAAPGRDYCGPCWIEELEGREVTRATALRLTAEHEALVEAQETT
jgi:hypothetical protein